MPIGETRDVVRQARAMAADTPAAERVRRAVERTRGTPTLGTLPVSDEESFPITSGGELVGRASADYVLLNNTALAAMRPGVKRMHRDHVAAMLQRFCEEIQIWPQQLPAS